MTLKDSIKQKLDSIVRGSCVFDKQDIAEVIKDFHIVYCNDCIIENDVLLVIFDDITLKFQLIWESLGPRQTLKELIQL